MKTHDILIKDPTNEVWYSLLASQDIMLLEELSFSFELFDKNFKSSENTFSFSLALSFIFLNKYKDVEYLEIVLYEIEEEKQKILFTGFAFFNLSIDLNNTIEKNHQKLVIVNFTCKDFNHLLDFASKDVFSPYNRSNPKPLKLIDIQNREQSILHLLFSHYHFSLEIDSTIDLPYITMSFVIYKNENVLDKLRQLFYEFNLYFYFDELGILRVKEIEISLEDSLESIDCTYSSSLTINDNPYKWIDLSFYESRYMSVEDLRVAKRTAWVIAYSVENLVVDDTITPPKTEVKIEYPAMIAYGDRYPSYEEDMSIPWYRVDTSNFLDFNINANIEEFTSYGTKYTKNKDISIITSFNHSFSYEFVEYQEDVVLEHFEVRNDSGKTLEFQFQFLNKHEPNEDNPLGLVKLKYASFISDIIYRYKEHNLKNEDDNLEEKDKWSVTLEYVDTIDVAKRFFRIAQNRLNLGNDIFKFKLKANLELGKKYNFSYLDEQGRVDYQVLLLKKSFSTKNPLEYSYEALKLYDEIVYEIKDDVTGNEKPESPIALSIANSYFKATKTALYYTSYQESTNNFISLDKKSFEEQSQGNVYIHSGRYYLTQEIDLKGSYTQEENALIFKRVLLTFNDKLRIENISPLIIKANMEVKNKYNNKGKNKYRYYLK